jgi:hypothetical protein
MNGQENLKQSYNAWKRAMSRVQERLTFVDKQMQESEEARRDYQAEWNALWDEHDDLYNQVNLEWNQLPEEDRA